MFTETPEGRASDLSRGKKPIRQEQMSEITREPLRGAEMARLSPYDLPMSSKISSFRLYPQLQIVKMLDS